MAKYIPPPPRRTSEEEYEWESFAISGIDVEMRRRTGSRSKHVPAVDSAYVLREELVAEVAYSAFPEDGDRALPAALLGPKGCGKTSLILQVAAHANVPCYRINLNVGNTVRHFKGHRGAKPGETVFYEGIAIRAMEEGAWLILDELSGATPPVALSLFPILEHDGDVLLEDAEPARYAVRHPDFRVFATDNVIGAMQEDSRFNYGGTNPEMNEALLDRFGAFINVTYLSPQQEFDAVKAIVPSVDELLLEGIIRLMNHLRESTIDYGFSTRMAINWAQRVARGYRKADGTSKALEPEQMLHAAEIAFLNGMRSKLDRDAASEIIVRLFPRDVAAPGGP